MKAKRQDIRELLIKAAAKKDSLNPQNPVTKAK
jgi:hypothetical protein